MTENVDGEFCSVFSTALQLQWRQSVPPDPAFGGVAAATTNCTASDKHVVAVYVSAL